MRDAGGEATAEVARAVEEFSRKLSEELRRSAQPGCCQTRDQRRQMRDSIHDAARRMSAAIREARRAARHSSSQSTSAEQPHPAAPDSPRSIPKLRRERRMPETRARSIRRPFRATS